MAEVDCVSNMLKTIRVYFSNAKSPRIGNVPVAKALVTSSLNYMLLWLMIDLCVPCNQISIKLSIVTPSQSPDVCMFESDAVANGACVSCMESIRAHYNNAKSDPGCIHVAVAEFFADIHLEHLAVVSFFMTSVWICVCGLGTLPSHMSLWLRFWQHRV